jgi:hypothetical protein
MRKLSPFIQGRKHADIPATILYSRLQSIPSYRNAQVGFCDVQTRSGSMMPHTLDGSIPGFPL